MRVLSIVSYYHPHWTGLTAHAVAAAEALAARGHDVTVLTTRHSAELAPDEVRNGVRVVRLTPVARVSRGMLAPAFVPTAAGLIAGNDVVQIHTPLPEALLVALLCRALGRPLVMTHHGDVVLPAGLFNQQVQRLACASLRAAGRMADAVTTYNRDYAERSPLLSGLADKLTCIHPPVDIPLPDPAAVAGWRSALRLGSGPVLGFAGRWVEEKGFDYLLRAMPMIRAVEPKARLFYAGEHRIVYEDFYERCRPLVRAQGENLSFAGLLRDRQTLADFYGACDVFALPSRTDNLAIVQVEALLCGTPVVASDIPGARVPVRETGFGRLARPGDPAALAEAILAVLRDPGRYRPNRPAVRAVFDTERTIDQYERLMTRLVCRSSARVSGAGARSRTGPSVPDERRGEASAPRLGTRDRAVLDGVLANEADMAFRRRARVLLGYLELRDGDRVLDCGCGMGFHLVAMGRLRRLRLVGLDVDFDRLGGARDRRAPGALVGGDLHRLPFADGSFDKVLMSEVLEHARDDAGALAEAYRVLRPGGVLALSVPHARYPLCWDPINRLWAKLGGEPIRSGPLVGIWTNHVRLYRPAELVERVSTAGLAVETAEEATHYSVPFNHFLLYGLGKPLVEHKLLPTSWRHGVDRFGDGGSNGSHVDPVKLGVALFRVVDRLNDAPGPPQDTFVNVLVRARRPS